MRTPGFWTRNLDQPFRTAVRDAVKAHGMNEMAIQATAADEVDRVVTEHLLTIIKETGVPVRILDVSLGRANPPDAILHQRVETAAQEQRINTEKQKKLAEDQRKLAEESRAAADQAYNQKMGLQHRAVRGAAGDPDAARGLRARAPARSSTARTRRRC